MPKREDELLLSGGKYQGYLILCGRGESHPPHIFGRVEEEQGWPPMERICPGDGCVFDLNLTRYPGGGMFAIEPVLNYPVSFVYISPQDAEKHFPARKRARKS